MTSRKLTIALIVVLLTPVVAAAGPAKRAVEPARLAAPTFVVEGRGWGHGIGLSQYGALGFARAGHGYQKILAHYYRGTALGPAPVRKVRVLVATDRATLTISSTAPFRVKDGTGATYELGAGKHALTPKLRLKVDEATEATSLTGPLMFMPGTQPVTLDRAYRGTIEVTVAKGKLQAINHVGLEQYLYGVVPAEMPHTWPTEALKAQAVVARSYAISHMKTGGPFDMYADTRSQVYRGIPEEEVQTNAAVNATAGQVVLYGGKVASTYYHSTSGGRTASITDAWPGAKPVPYLVSVPDPYDSISPHHSWGPVVFKAEQLARVLRVPGRLVDVRVTVNGSQRITSIVGVGTQGEGPTVDPATFRRALDLRSTWLVLGVLSLERPNKPVTYGSRFQLAGLARFGSPATLESRGAGEQWKSAGTVKGGADGSFAVALKPKATTSYRLALGDVRSAAVRVGVAPVVRIAAAQGRTALRGVVKPAIPGSRVQVQRLNAFTWKTIATATADQAGRWQAAVNLRPGTYRARVPAGPIFAAATSSVLTVSPA
ncbi:MAG: SpoIID/LytB domain-containing protein [Thermoleophilia bacterium]|nr:SpoIID/LytB domain-containing protein [Thermoleophilia bacterium]